MNKDVVIIGASGHARVIADIVKANGDNLIGFLDDDRLKESLGIIDQYIEYPNAAFVVGIGDSNIRKAICKKLNCEWYTAIHPSAVISPSATIGQGTVIMPNAVINANAEIGIHCIINTSSVVEHNDVIGDYSHISVGARLGGSVKVGDLSWIGIGATVNNNVSICGNCVIGAGAVVIKNIEKPGIYVGVPSKELQE